MLMRLTIFSLLCAIVFSSLVKAAPVTGIVDGQGEFNSDALAIHNDPCHLGKFQFEFEGQVFRMPGAYFLCSKVQLGFRNDLAFFVDQTKIYLNQEVVGTWTDDEVTYEATDINANVTYRFHWKKLDEKTAKVTYALTTDPDYDPTFEFVGEIPLAPIKR